MPLSLGCILSVDMADSNPNILHTQATFRHAEKLEHNIIQRIQSNAFHRLPQQMFVKFTG